MEATNTIESLKNNGVAQETDSCHFNGDGENTNGTPNGLLELKRRVGLFSGVAMIAGTMIGCNC